MKKKIIIILMLTLLLAGCKDKNTNNNVTNNTTSEEETIIKQIEEEEAIKIEKDLYGQAEEEFYKIFGEDYVFSMPENKNVASYSIEMLVQTRGFDASFLEAEGCNLKTSWFNILEMEDGEQILSVKLDCSNEDKTEETTNNTTE